MTRVEQTFRGDNKTQTQYEVELEIPHKFTLSKLNEWIDIILHQLFDTEVVLTNFDKIIVFDKINSIIADKNNLPFPGTLDSSQLPQLRNLKYRDLSSQGLFPSDGRIFGQVTIKTDGKRKFLWVTPKSAYLVMSADFLNKLNITFDYSVPTNMEYSLFEGEYLDDTLYLYDTLIYNNRDVRQENHRNRLSYAELATGLKGISNINLQLKNFYPFPNSTMFYWFVDYILSQDYPYPTDGLVITPDLPTQSMKWKPSEKLSIDFRYINKKLYVGKDVIFKPLADKTFDFPAEDGSIIEVNFTIDFRIQIS